jgi:hypothetical protein
MSRGAMCGRLRVGKENLHVTRLGRCSFKLTHRAALAAPAQPVDPAILHGALQRSREEMTLP